MAENQTVSADARTEDCRGGLPRWVHVCLLVAFAFSFWFLRLRYWHFTSEAPFSDIGGYVLVGSNIAKDFYFGVNNHLNSYYTPVTPAAIAVAKLISESHAAACSGPVSFEAR